MAMAAIAYRARAGAFNPAPRPSWRPANDNRAPPVGRPANDNRPSPRSQFPQGYPGSNPGVADGLKWAARVAKIALPLGKLGLRLNPIGNLLLSGLELYPGEEPIPPQLEVPEHFENINLVGITRQCNGFVHCYTGPHTKHNNLQSLITQGVDLCQFQPALECTPFQVPSGNLVDGQTYDFSFTGGTFGTRCAVVWTGPAQLSGTRFQTETLYVWGTNSSGNKTVIVKWHDRVPAIEAVPGIWTAPHPVAAPYPQLDPLTLPISRPVPAPRPLPWRVLPNVRPNPFRDPHEQPVRGPGPATQPVRDGRPLTDTPIVITPRPRPRPRPVEPSGPRPPGPREHERKIRLTAGLGAGAALAISAIRRAHHGFTEAMDVTDALWRALPYSIRRKYGSTPQGKMEALYRHWNQVDMNKAIRNLIQNEILDRTLGRLHGAAGRGARRHGVTLGPSGSGSAGSYLNF